MQYHLVFDNTGDVIPLISDNAEVLEYFVDSLDRAGNNNFHLEPTYGYRLKNGLQLLHIQIESINTWATELLNGSIATHSIDGYLDQQVLNRLHSDWVQSQSQEYNIVEKCQRYNSEQSRLIHSYYPDDIPSPKLSSVIKHLGLSDEYDKLNTRIHQLESVLYESVQCTTASWVEFANPFSKSLVTDSIGNFAIGFRHLGRTLYNKFSNSDLDLVYNDENTFDQLIACVDLQLAMPQTILPSAEYVAWCKRHNQIPSGNRIIIGNIPDLTNRLTEYRQIIFRNSLQNNSFTIQLNKG